EKSVPLFLFEAGPDAKAHVTGAEGISDVRWFPVQEAQSISAYRNLDVLLKKALDLTGSAGATSDIPEGLV
ncbi:hypothetical protein L0Y59_03135, partial [Candidatus Uhrbacteria bacterium]|nr:hypothetical protein [Candidatus Uhrbacteria bacterium]